jgi:2-methylcitrate dehydratase PrpD
LAREGFTGAREVFVGRFGFFPMYQPEGYDVSAISEDLGAVFRGVELSFKPYPCGRPHHAIIDAALELYRRLELGATDAEARIADVVITTDPRTYGDQLGPVSTRRRPSQVVEAQFSMPFLVAAALVYGRVGISEVAGVDDPRVLAVAERIRGVVRADARVNWARLEVRHADARRDFVETTSPSGSPAKPLSDAQLQAKFRDCAAHAVRSIPQANVEEAIQLVHHLKDVPDTTALIQLFT